MNLIMLKIGAGIALVIALLGIGFFFGSSWVDSKWTAAKLKDAKTTQAAILAAVAKRDQEHAEQLKHTNEVIEGYANSTQQLRDKIAADRLAADRQRLRITIPARNCPAPSGQTASTVPADGARGTEEIELPATTESDLLDLAEDADREVGMCYAKLNGLRDWIVKEGMYGP